MRSGLGSGQNQGFHLGHGAFETDEKRVRDQGVTDIQFVDALDRSHGFDVVVMQAMAGIDDQAFVEPAVHAVDDALQLIGHFSRRGGIGITASVQLDGRGADTAGGFDLAFVGVDKQ